MDTHLQYRLLIRYAAFVDTPEAEHYYDRSIRFLPGQVAAHVAKASLLWEWKGVEKARVALEAMPEKESNSSFGAIHWIWQEIFEGNYTAALARIAGLSDDIVASRTKDLLRGQIHAVMGEQEMSRKAFGSALKGFEGESRAESENPYLHAVLGIVYAGLGLLGIFEYLPLFPTQLSVAMLRTDPRWKPLAEQRFVRSTPRHKAWPHAVGASDQRRFLKAFSENAIPSVCVWFCGAAIVDLRHLVRRCSEDEDEQYGAACKPEHRKVKGTALGQKPPTLALS